GPASQRRLERHGQDVAHADVQPVQGREADVVGARVAQRAPLRLGVERLDRGARERRLDLRDATGQRLGRQVTPEVERLNDIFERWYRKHGLKITTRRRRADVGRMFMGKVMCAIAIVLAFAAPASAEPEKAVEIVNKDGHLTVSDGSSFYRLDKGG